MVSNFKIQLSKICNVSLGKNSLKLKPGVHKEKSTCK